MSPRSLLVLIALTLASSSGAGAANGAAPRSRRVETEGTPNVVPYWQAYSRRESYRNYLNIGIYSEAMKAEQRRVSSEMITHANGYLLASTWLQFPPPFGPNLRPEGDGSPENPGILWWLEHIREQHTGAR